MAQNAEVVKLYKNIFLDLINKIEENDKKIKEIVNAKMVAYANVKDVDEVNIHDEKFNDIQKIVLNRLERIKLNTDVMRSLIWHFRNEENSDYIYSFRDEYAATYSSYMVYKALSNDEDKELENAINTRLQLLTDFSKLFLQHLLKVKNITIDINNDNTIKLRLTLAAKYAKKLLYRITKLINALKSNSINQIEENKKLYLTYANLLQKAKAAIKQKIEQFNKNEIKDIIEYLFEYQKYLYLVEAITNNIIMKHENRFSRDLKKLADKVQLTEIDVYEQLTTILLHLTL